MTYKIKTPVMASDVPEAVKLIMSDKRGELLELIVERCTINEDGEKVDTSNLTLKQKFDLVAQAGAGFSEASVGNG
jgi:hypothetical protein